MGQRISAETLYHHLRAGVRLTLIDVRWSQLGEIPGAVHVPVIDLEDIPRPWPQDEDLVVFCQQGRGVGDYAAEVLEEQGYTRVLVLEGGLDAYLRVVNEKAANAQP